MPLQMKLSGWMAEHAGTNKRLAIDKIEYVGYAAFKTRGIEVLQGQMLTEHARSIKMKMS